jgi:hypothetical protein
MLGANMPVSNIAVAADRLRADVVVSAMLREPASRSTRALGTLARRHRVLLAGPGFDDGIARRAGAEYLAEHPVGAAERVLTTEADRTDNEATRSPLVPCAGGPSVARPNRGGRLVRTDS